MTDQNKPKTKTEIYKENRDESKARSLADNEKLRRDLVRQLNDYRATIVRPNDKSMRVLLNYYDQIRKINNDIEASKKAATVDEILERLKLIEQNQQPIKRIV